MPKTASIAQARNHLPALVHSAEAGMPTQLTRHGKPVAVLHSIVDYDRLQKGPAVPFGQAALDFRQEVDVAHLDLASAFVDLRDPSPGRAPPW